MAVSKMATGTDAFRAKSGDCISPSWFSMLFSQFVDVTRNNSIRFLPLTGVMMLFHRATDFLKICCTVCWFTQWNFAHQKIAAHFVTDSNETATRHDTIAYCLRGQQAELACGLFRWHAVWANIIDPHGIALIHRGLLEAIHPPSILPRRASGTRFDSLAQIVKRQFTERGTS